MVIWNVDEFFGKQFSFAEHTTTITQRCMQNNWRNIDNGNDKQTEKLTQSASTSAAILQSKPITAPAQPQKQTSYATSTVMSNVSCVHVTRDTGKKRAADNNMLQLVHD